MHHVLVERSEGALWLPVTDSGEKFQQRFRRTAANIATPLFPGIQ
jgi:hypothetical protein